MILWKGPAKFAARIWSLCLAARVTSNKGRSQQGHLISAAKNVSANLLVLSCLIAERIARTNQAWQTRATSINGRPQQRHLFTVKWSFSGPCKVCCLNLISFASLHVWPPLMEDLSKGIFSSPNHPSQRSCKVWC